MVVLRTENEWRVLGRYVKPFALADSLNNDGALVYGEEKTFLAGTHPYHVPNFVGGYEDDSLARDNG